MTRSIRFHAFCSAKGGVGKSTLAVMSASWLAEHDRSVVLLDVDLTGNSLADGLQLCAPEVALLHDGTMDLLAPPTGRYLSRVETVSLRDQRQWNAGSETVMPPPFLNDALTFPGTQDGRECRFDALLWQHETQPGMRVLPVSSLRRDVTVALGWLYREEHFRWARRFAWILYALAIQIEHLSDVVIDLPPGLFGFSQATLSILAVLSGSVATPRGFPPFSELGSRIEVNPFLVTTPDGNALVVSVEEYLRLRPQLGNLELVVNRAYDGVRTAVDELEARFGAQEIGRASCRERVSSPV